MKDFSVIPMLLPFENWDFFSDTKSGMFKNHPQTKKTDV